MKPDHTILQELQSISPFLASLERVNVFSVPTDYFNQLSDSVLSTLNNEHTSFGNIQSPDFDLPEGYFENLSNNILGKIQANQQEEKLFVDGLEKINTFTVPEKYFDELPLRILSKIKNKKAPVISLSIHSSIVKYAVAAMLTGFMALGIYKYIGHSGSHQAIASSQFASLDSTIVKGKNMNDQQFDQSLQNLSKEEIAVYLEKNINEKDVQDLAANIDESTLPSKDEYLTNENVLDKYLGE